MKKNKFLTILTMIFFLLAAIYIGSFFILSNEHKSSKLNRTSFFSLFSPKEVKQQYENPSTGLLTENEAVLQKPYLIAIDNIKKALPQSGLSSAAIVYEILSEGDITRLLALFSADTDPTVRIGPVRSARHYFLSIADDHDAIFVHHGASPQAYQQIAKEKIKTLNGMYYDGKYFKRDQARYQRLSLREHSSYLTFADLQQASEDLSLQGKWDRRVFTSFSNSNDKFQDGESAKKIEINFSKQHSSKLFYDSESGSYEKFFRNDPQIDGQTNEVLRFHNLIIQICQISHIPGDEQGRREFGLIGKGKGYYAKGGKIIPIQWEKTDKEPTHFYDVDGQALELSCGKTYVAVVASNHDLFWE